MLAFIQTKIRPRLGPFTKENVEMDVIGIKKLLFVCRKKDIEFL